MDGDQGEDVAGVRRDAPRGADRQGAEPGRDGAVSNDIERARRVRIRAEREVARQIWLNQLSIDIRVTWPGGIFGWLHGIALMLAPVWLVVLAVWIGKKLNRTRRDRPNDPARSA